MRVGLLIGMILSCKDDDFGDYALGSTSSASTISELDEYLRLPTVKTNDPLAWWQDNHRTYPISKTAFFGHRCYSFLACLQVCTAWTDSSMLYKAVARYVHLALSLYSLTHISQSMQAYW